MRPNQAEAVSVYRKVLRNCGTYSVGVIASRITGVVLLPVYSRLLTPADYGIMALLDLTLYVASALFGMHLAEAIFYFHSKAGTDRDRDTVLTTAIAASALLGAVVGILGFLVAGSVSSVIAGSAKYADLFRIQFVSVALTLPTEAGYCSIRALNRASQYVRTSITQLLLGVGLTLLLLVRYRLGVAGMLAAAAVAQAFTLGMMICRIRAHLRCVPDVRLFARIVTYSWPLALSSTLMLIVHFGDTFALRHFVSLTQVGIYSLAYRIGMLVAFVELPYSRYWGAQMFHVVREVGGSEVFSRMCTYRAAVLSSAAVSLAVCAGPVLKIALPVSYSNAAKYVPWVAAAYVIRSVGSHFLDVLLIEGRTARQLGIIALGTVVCVAGYATLIPLLGLYGAVLATILCFATMMFLAYAAAQRVGRFRFEVGRLLKIGACTITVMVGYEFCRPVALHWLSTFAVLFTAAYPALLVAVRLFTPSEIQSIRSSVAELLPG